jgi:trimeric autotransporter adhesin
MSTKTIYKRIALVAVAALGAGVLSVAPANAANNGVAGAADAPAPLANVLNIATEASITGAAIVVATVEDGATTAGSFNDSLGLLANTTTVDVNSLTSTATMRADGEIVFYTKTDNDVAATFEVVGGTFGTVAAESGSFNNVNNTKTSFVTGKATAATQIAFSVKPNVGATTMTVSMFKSASLATIDQTKVNAVQAGTTSKGTLIQRYTVTVATTSLSGAYSSTFSAVRAVLSGTAGAAETSNIDETGATSIANAASSVGFVNINLRDAYNVELPAGALIINATNGAGLAWNASGGASASGFNLVAVATDTTGTLTVARPAASANRGFSTTVTVNWNGAVVGTKTFTFLGEVATVTASAPAIGALSASNTSAFRLAYADSAGNALYPTITDTSAVSSTLTSSVTGLAVGTIGSSTAGLARGTLTCGAAAGSADVQVQHVNPLSGTVVRSNIWKATCAGDAASYTASWDRASYTPGSIATLSITFRDARGNLANAYTAVSTTGNLITITGGPSATAVTAPANGDAADSADGIKRYQFVVGTTTGDFSAVVSAPVVNAAAPTTAANQTVSYKVANATTGTTNEDVLKAIVSLIASINKQIAALQKALLRR